jgi:predicted transcriptional regulator
MDVLRNEGKPMTVTEVFNAMSENPEVSSTQKVSALMRQLLLEGRVVKTMEKRVSYFSAV